jgi:hypothetical protein|tara:strand:+ start:270 stop:461 length:192 start_codon:yes stop_codon:yes gene_type:complete
MKLTPINTQRVIEAQFNERLAELCFIHWVNDFLTIDRFAEYYGVSDDIALKVISLGRKTNYSH